MITGNGSGRLDTNAIQDSPVTSVWQWPSRLWKQVLRGHCHLTSTHCPIGGHGYNTWQVWKRGMALLSFSSGIFPSSFYPFEIMSALSIKMTHIYVVCSSPQGFFMWVIPFTLTSTPESRWVLLLFYRWGKWGSERWSHSSPWAR